MPLAISSQRVSIWYHSDPRHQWKEEGDMAIFFKIGLGLSLGAKLVSTNDRPSMFSVIFRIFPGGGEKKKTVPHFALSG